MKSVVIVALLASVLIGATLPVGAQGVGISPVIEPAPPVPTPEPAQTDQPCDCQPGPTDQPEPTAQPHHGDGGHGDGEAPVLDVPVRWVYAGQPFGWVGVYD